jgi:hypothetical protein
VSIVQVGPVGVIVMDFLDQNGVMPMVGAAEVISEHPARR